MFLQILDQCAFLLVLAREVIYRSTLLSCGGFQCGKENGLFFGLMMRVAKLTQKAQQLFRVTPIHIQRLLQPTANRVQKRRALSG